MFSFAIRNPRPLLDVVRRIETIATTEVVHVGITSRIHIIAVKTNIAITRCCVSVKIGSRVSGLTP